MMDANQRRADIIRMVANHQITSEEGYALLKQPGHGNNSEPGMELLLTRPIWESTPALRTGGIASETVYAVVGEAGPALRTSGLLQGAGANNIYQIVEGTGYPDIGGSYTADPSKPEEYERALLSVCEQTSGPVTVICLAGGKPENTPLTLFGICKALAAQSPARSVTVLFIYREGSSPYWEAAPALLKSAHAENPAFHFRTVALDGGDIARTAVAELNDIRCEEIRVQDHIRYIKSRKEIDGNADSAPIKTGGVYVITGGSGKLGAMFASEIEEKHRAAVVLCGRAASPKGSQGKYRYISADISKTNAAEFLLEQVYREYGCVNGVIHCAGCLSDSFIKNKSYEEFNGVLLPKTIGTLNLLEAARKYRPELFVMFSSVSAVLGNVGQCDYAYANAFMDASAHSSRDTAGIGRVVSINWPLWKDGGMQLGEASEKMMFKKSGMAPLDRICGTRAFKAAIASGEPQVSVFYGNADRIRARLDTHVPVSKTPVVFSEVPGADRETLHAGMVEYFKKLLNEETKIPLDEIDARDSFELYGIDSVTAMHITDRLENDFGELSKTLLFEYHNIDEMSSYFVVSFQDKVAEKLDLKPLPRRCEPEQEKTIQQAEDTEIPAKEYGAAMEKPFSAQAGKGYEGQRDIAVVGMSGRYPMARNLHEFWDNLKKGRDCITEIRSDRWDAGEYYDPRKDILGKSYGKWGGFIDDVDKFDPLFFNISPRDARAMDPQERLFLETAWHAVENGGYRREQLKDLSVGVFVGVMYGQYQMIPSFVDGKKLAHISIYSSIANRVSYCLNLHGPSIALDTMCSSSLTAVHLACRSIIDGESDMAIAGGVNLSIIPDKYLYLSEGHFLSSDGRCRSFGDGGDGYVPGEGVGAVLLKPFEKAERDGDYIYGVIKGSAINHGGRTSAYTVPDPIAQSETILSAMEQGGISPETVSYVETHGTGTALGDPIEVNGLTRAFEKYTKKKHFCAIGSVKSNIGHAEASAGIASLTKVLLQMKYGKLVPSLHAETENKNINFAKTPFYVQKQLDDWDNPFGSENRGFARRAGISCFGAGGSNAHIVVEEYRRKASVGAEIRKPAVVVLSAKSRERLEEYAKILMEFLERGGLDTGTELSDIAYTLQTGRETMKHRLAVFADSVEKVTGKLKAFLKNGEEAGVYTGEISKKNIAQTLLDGDEGKEYLNIVARQGKMDKLARLWTMGADLDWNVLYAGTKPKRIPLPGYPFARERYWLPNSETGKTHRLRPYVDENISGFDGVEFVSHIDCGHPPVICCRIDGKGILSAAVPVEVLCEAAEISLCGKVCEIHNVTFAGAPVADEKTAMFRTELFRSAEGCLGQFTGPDGTILAQAEIRVQPEAGQSVYKQIVQDTQGLAVTRNGDAGEKRLDPYIPDVPFKVEEAFSSGNEITAQLHMQKDLYEKSEDEVFPPALLFAVLRLCSAESGGGVFLPDKIGRIVFLQKPSEICSIRITRTVNGDDAKEFDVVFTNEDGQTAITVSGLSLRGTASSEI